MKGLSVLIVSVACVIVASVASAQEPTEPTEHTEHAEGEEHEHKNGLAFVAANTYEAEDEANFFTLGGEYSRALTERLGIIAEFEYLPKPNAWVFVVPVKVIVWREHEVFGGPGIEHLSRRSDGEDEAGGHGETESESGADNLFLVRVGAAYHVPLALGERF